MSFQNWVSLIVALLMVGGPVLGKVFEHLRQAKKKREREMALRQAQLDALRTGRAAETNAQFRTDQPTTRISTDTPSPVLGSPGALTNRSPLQAPRRPMGQPNSQPSQPSRQPSSQPQVAASPSGRVQTRTLRLPGGIMIEVPVEAEPTQARAQQPPPRPQKQKQRKQQPRPVEAPRAAVSTATAKFEVTRQEVFDSQQTVAANALAGAGAPSRGAALSPSARVASRGGFGALLPKNATRADVKRAVVLSEIFGRPVGER